MTSNHGELVFSKDTIKVITQEVDVSESEIELAIVLTHLILGVNPFINPTATLSFLIEGISVNMDDKKAVELGQLIARTASVNGHGHNEDLQ